MRESVLLLIVATLSGAADLPSRATIEKVEAAYAFSEDATIVGLPGVISASDAGRRWRVKVRALSCSRQEVGTTCSYETKPCLDAPDQGAIRLWCPRERQFQHGDGFASADGWEIAPGRS